MNSVRSSGWRNRLSECWLRATCHHDVVAVDGTSAGSTAATSRAISASIATATQNGTVMPQTTVAPAINGPASQPM